jgi:hypothetical protein
LFVFVRGKVRFPAAKTIKALEKGLKELEKQANHILKEPATVDTYIATLYLLDVQIGLIRGYEYYVDKDWRGDYLVLVDFIKTYDTWYTQWETSVSYDWTEVNTSVDIYEGEDVDLSESISDEEVNSEDSYAENESFDMNEAEEDQVAAEEDTDEEVRYCSCPLQRSPLTLQIQRLNHYEISTSFVFVPRSGNLRLRHDPRRTGADVGLVGSLFTSPSLAAAFR